MQDKIKQLHAQISERFRKTHTCVEHEPGDRVWVRNLPHEGDKLDPLWTGPCEILDRVGLRGRYQVAIGGSVVDVHADRLKMYLPHVDGTKIVLNYYRPHHNVPEDDSLVVASILRHRIRDGQYQWYVRWKGYDDSHNTWEPASSFIGLVQQDWMRYNKQHHINIAFNSLQR